MITLKDALDILKRNGFPEITASSEDYFKIADYLKAYQSLLLMDTGKLKEEIRNAQFVPHHDYEPLMKEAQKFANENKNIPEAYQLKLSELCRDFIVRQTLTIVKLSTVQAVEEAVKKALDDFQEWVNKDVREKDAPISCRLCLKGIVEEYKKQALKSKPYNPICPKEQ
jgi:alpha-L-arabinofuranosidase